jgi:hypothetical protein
MGQRPTVAVAGEEVQYRHQAPVWGLSDGIPALVPNRDVWLRARTILREGGSIAALVDRGLSNPIHPNTFGFIRAAGARAVFAIVELQPDGEILVDFFDPPDPYFKTDESIALSLELLTSRRESILGSVAAEPVTVLKSALRPEQD